MQKLEGQFALAERRVSTGARLLKRQAKLVGRRRSAGRDAVQAFSIRSRTSIGFLRLREKKPQ
jgi:hypothetical protein